MAYDVGKFTAVNLGTLDRVRRTAILTAATDNQMALALNALSVQERIPFFTADDPGNNVGDAAARIVRESPVVQGAIGAALATLVHGAAAPAPGTVTAAQFATLLNPATAAAGYNAVLQASADTRALIGLPAGENISDTAAEVLRADVRVQAKLGAALATVVHGAAAPAPGAVTAAQFATLLNPATAAAYNAVLQTSDDARALIGLPAGQNISDAAAGVLMADVRVQAKLGTAYGTKLAAAAAAAVNFGTASIAQIGGALSVPLAAALPFQTALAANADLASVFGIVPPADPANLNLQAVTALRSNADLGRALGNAFAEKIAAGDINFGAATYPAIAQLMIAQDDGEFRAALQANAALAKVFGIDPPANAANLSNEVATALRTNANLQKALGSAMAPRVALRTGGGPIDFGLATNAQIENLLIAETDLNFQRALANADPSLALQVFGILQVNAPRLHNAAAEGLRTNPALKHALVSSYIAKNIMERAPLAAAPLVAGAGAQLSGPTLDSIARATTGAQLITALDGTGIPLNIRNKIPLGSITNPQLIALQTAAKQGTLLQFVKDPLNATPIKRLAMAKEGPGVEAATRAAITATPELAPFATLDAATLETARVAAVIAYNQHILQFQITKSLDDKALLKRFIDAPGDPERLVLINENKGKFGVGRCAGTDAAGNLPATAVSPVVLAGLKLNADSRLMAVRNYSASDSTTIRQKLNVAVAVTTLPGQTTPFGYSCKLVTKEDEIEALVKQATDARGGGGVYIAAVVNQRVEKAVKTGETVRWAKNAECTDGTNQMVQIVRDPSGTMSTTNNAKDLAKLTSVEKRALAMQLAQEYVANMIEGRKKELHITCGDLELGKMIYAAALSIKLQAKEYCKECEFNDKTKNPSIESFAKEVTIFAPPGVESLHGSWDMTQKSFIKKELGESQKSLKDKLGDPALRNYGETTNKMAAINKAEQKLSTATQNLAAAKEGLFESKARFEAKKLDLQTLKATRTAEVATKKTELMEAEEKREDKLRPG